jgi:hypothetical protein
MDCASSPSQRCRLCPLRRELKVPSHRRRPTGGTNHRARDTIIEKERYAGSTDNVLATVQGQQPAGCALLRCRDRHDRFVTELLAGKSFIYQVRSGGRLAAVTAGLARTTFG